MLKSKALAAVGLLVVMALPLGGCSSLWGSDNTATIENPDPPDKMYADAEGYMSAGDFLAAAKKYEDVERNYPFSNDPSKPYARKSLALASYAYYKAGEYEDAISAGKRYTTMHAGTEDAALAHHVVGMSYFSQMSDATRDQTATRKAMEEFRTLIRLYPNSSYAQEDENRLRIAEDNLAAAEMTVGRYYLKRDNYLAAINRFRTVIAEFQTTKHVEEALYRLTESYLALGIQPEAQTAAAILGHNFPNSSWYQDAYALLTKDGLKPVESAGSVADAWKTAVQPAGQQASVQ